MLKRRRSATVYLRRGSNCSESERRRHEVIFPGTRRVYLLYLFNFFINSLAVWLQCSCRLSKSLTEFSVVENDYDVIVQPPTPILAMLLQGRVCLSLCSQTLCVQRVLVSLPDSQMYTDVI